MNRQLLLIVILMPVFAFFACNREGSMMTDLRNDSGKRLWEDITDDDTYTSWKLWPGTRKFFSAAAPHGPLAVTYVNKEAYNAITGGDKAMPKDAIIVMENWTDGLSLTSVTVMKKIPGFNPNAGDYLWAQYNAHGDAIQVGMTEECFTCHAKNATNDFIMHEQLGTR